MADKNVSLESGSTSTILFIVFLVLKLCGVIGWSWWWVTAPLWIPVLIVLGIIVVLLAVMVIAKKKGI